MQKAILAEWGITLLGGKSDHPGKALTDFLDRLNKRVKKKS